MDPSYNVSGGVAGAPGVSGVSGIAGASGVAGASGFSAAPSGDVVLAPEGKKKRRWVPIAVAIVVVALVVVGVAVGVVAMNNHKSGQKADAEELVSLLSWAGATGQCPNVTNEMREYATDEIYDGYLNECREDAVKISSLLNLTANLSGEVGYKTVYAALKDQVLSTVLFGDELEDALKIYKAWHDFSEEVEGMSILQTEAQVDAAVTGLIESGDKTLREFGEKWAAARKNMIDKYLDIEIHGDSVDTRREYEIARNAYAEVLENAPDVTELTDLNNDPSRSEHLGNAVLDYKVYIRSEL